MRDGDLLSHVSVLVFLSKCGMQRKHWAGGSLWLFTANCFLSGSHSDKNIGFQNAYISNGQISNLSHQHADERHSLKCEVLTPSSRG
jgi:hypothetical protein